jgi:hypothetical protein
MDELIRKLEAYKEDRGLTYRQLAQKLDIPEVYLYRWKEKGVKGIYAKVVGDFLEKGSIKK